MLCVVGNLTVDEVVVEKEKRVQAGGAALYASAAAAKMAIEAGVVSKVGYDYPEEHLRQLVSFGVDVTGVKTVQDAATTRFVLDYSGTERRLFLRARCKRIEPEDVQGISAEAVHIGAVFDEVPLRTVLELSVRCGFLSLDPQGLVRRATRDREVLPKSWFDARVLSRLTFFKSSSEELAYITGSGDLWTGMEKIAKRGPEIIVVTQGEAGALMMAGSRRFRVPAFPTRAVDPTGAGDAFVGGFLSQYLRDQDHLWAASCGAALASFIVETQGCSIEGSIGSIYERASWIRQRMERL